MDISKILKARCRGLVAIEGLNGVGKSTLVNPKFQEAVVLLIAS